jgi:hypothetical protein
LIESILYSNVPESTFTFTLSHFFFHKRVFQTGESLEINDGFANISDSVEPTIFTVSFSFVSVLSISTIAHILIFSDLLLDSLIISTLFN